MTSFTVYGEPQGKARPRFAKGRAYTPKKTVEYEKAIQEAYLEQCNTMYDGDAVQLIVYAFFKIPKSASKKEKQLMIAQRAFPTKKPDADNILKVVCDALNGVAYTDDKQIVHMECTKVYNTEEKPRIDVTIAKYY